MRARACIAPVASKSNIALPFRNPGEHHARGGLLDIAGAGVRTVKLSHETHLATPWSRVQTDRSICCSIVSLLSVPLRMATYSALDWDH
jgi:hypothetical protein